MRLIEDHQRRPPKLARQVDERFQEEFYEAPAVRQLEFVEIHDRGNLVFEQSPRKQRRVARIRGQLAAGADQQHVDRFAQTCELALVVENDGLDPGALGNQTEQPRLAAAGIGLNEEPGVDQCGEVELQLRTVNDLTDDHRRFRTRLSPHIARTSPGITSPRASRHQLPAAPMPPATADAVGYEWQ